MNTQSLSSQLMDSGLFASVQASATPGLPARAILNGAGHLLLVEQGWAVFSRAAGHTPADRASSEPGWQLGEVDGHIWPAEAFANPEAMPPLLSHLREGPVHRLLFDIRPGLSWFRGHFPGKPVLAGVAQLHLAALLARSLFDQPGFPRRITRLKFQSLVIPPCILELRLEPVEAGEIRFRFHARGRDHSQGRLYFSGTAS